MRVTILDYGAGNLHSLAKALDDGSSCVRVEADPIAAVNCDLLVLPGVGAFGHAAASLASGRDVLRDAIRGACRASVSASACSSSSTRATRARAQGLA